MIGCSCEGHSSMKQGMFCMFFQVFSETELKSIPYAWKNALRMELISDTGGSICRRQNIFQEIELYKSLELYSEDGLEWLQCNYIITISILRECSVLARDDFG